MYSKIILVAVLVLLVSTLPVITVAAPPQAVPLPDPARGPAIDPQKGYLVQEVRGGLYWLTDGSYQMMFLTTGQGVIIVDAPPSLGQKILLAVGEVTKEPITHVVYSHHHADHIGAANLYPSNATIVAQEETAAQLARDKDPNRPLPTVTFKDSYTLKVGNQVLELSYKGPNHSRGNIFIYAPAQKTLMLVDVIFPGWVPFMNLALAEDIPGFFAAHDQVLAYDFDTFIGGHLTRLGTRQDVEIQKQYVSDVKANAMSALQQVNFMDVAKKTGFENQWLLFDTYFNNVAQTCADKTVPNWVNRLGGADVWTFGHCLRAAESARID